MCRVLLPPLTIALTTVTAAALLLAAAVLVPPPLPAASALMLPAAAAPTPRIATSGATLAQSVRVSLPQTPAVVDLARLIYAPGAEGAPQALLGPLLLVVESGSLTAQLHGEAQLLRAGQTLPLAAGDHALRSGDGLVLPRITPAAFRNGGTVPAVALAAAIFPSGVVGSNFGRVGLARWNDSWSPGATVQPLAGGWIGASTAESATLTAQRLTLATDERLPLTASGPVDLAVEVGALTLQADGGLVWRQAPQGADQFVAPAGEATLLPGDAALLQDAAEVTLRNDGSGPLVALALSVELDRGPPRHLPRVTTTPDPHAGLPARYWAPSLATPAPQPHAMAQVGTSTPPPSDVADPRAYLTQMTAIQHRQGVPLPGNISRLQSLLGNATPVAPCHAVVSC